MICGRCKNNIADNVQTCPYCGQPCNAINTAPPFQPPPVQQTLAMNNYKDLSKENGFQLEFYCENCRGAIYRTPYTASQQYAKKKNMQMLGLAGAIVGGFGGLGALAGASMSVAAIANTPISGPFAGMSPEWHREHEWYLSMAQRDAGQYYRRCNHCGKYVCGQCFDQGTGICSGCIAAIPAICPSCSAPTGASAICTYCGAKLIVEQDQTQQAGLSPQAQAFAQIFDNNMKVAQGAFGARPCTRCGRTNWPGTVFCQGCGAKL